jgi:uncharacterized protein involved in outer membrane biogenesis
MSEEAEQVEQYMEQAGRWRRRATLIFLIAMVIAAAVVLPPLINISRYQRQITALMTRSLGRPVQLGSVKLRLLPRPGFVLTNLSVGEAAEFGVEPILSAQTVVASIRLSALLTGKVEVERISLDEASLNLVQSGPGRWNLEQIMMGGLVQGMNQTAPTASQPVFRRQAAAFPYLTATNSRVNVKRGLEKLPYSLVGTQLSFWQESPGVWRLRLRGQPARTDMEMSTADAGDLRLEATLQTLGGRGLYQMPLKVQAEWKEAQLGQLSRLLVGSDQGWRGDLTADLSMQGTADEAQTEARLRATSVRREEFVPASPMDFDFHCGLLYEHTKHAVRNLACNTAIGDGKLLVKADLPGEGGQPEASLTVDQLPLQAGLDMLRTLRSGFAPGVSAEGKVSGAVQLSSAPMVVAKPGVRPAAKAGPVAKTGQALAKSGQVAKAGPANGGAAGFQGEMTISDGSLRGGALSKPLALPKIVLTAAGNPGAGPGNAAEAGLSTRFALALGGVEGGKAAPESGKAAAESGKAAAAGAKAETAAAPVRRQELMVRLLLTAAGYQVGVSGSAAPERLRELVYALGVKRSQAMDSVAGGQADVDGMGVGPWVTSADVPAAAPVQSATPIRGDAQAKGPSAKSGFGAKSGMGVRPGTLATSVMSSMAAVAPGGSDTLTGTVHLHRVAWAAPYLAHAVEFPEAVVSLTGKTASASGSFVYGALTGTASVNGIRNSCAGSECAPEVEIHLGSVDAATIEGALLGAPEKKTLLSPLMDRVRSSQPTPWPDAAVKVEAESLALGPVTMHKAVLAMKLKGKELTLESWQAGLLGGEAKGTGRAGWNGSQLAYTIEGSFSGITGAQLGALLDREDARVDAKASAHADAKAETHGNAEAGAKPASGEDDEEQKAPAGPPATATAGMWAGGPVDGSGKVELSGLTAKELAASAAGTVHFHWVKGAVPVSAAGAAPAGAAAETKTAETGTAGTGTSGTGTFGTGASGTGTAGTGVAGKAAVATRFDAWTGTATIGGGKIVLGSNSLNLGKHAAAVAGSVPFGGAAKFTLAAGKPAETQAEAGAGASPAKK